MLLLNATSKNIKKASVVIKNGGLVVYPTDTVYGVGCNPFDVSAVQKLFSVKGERKKPLPLLAHSIEDVERVALLSTYARQISEAFWPGPLTLVLPKKEVLPNVVTCNLKTVGVRIPGHNVAAQLIRLSNGLITGTSANKSGKPPPTTAHEAAGQLGEYVDVLLDGGAVPLGTPSTIVDLTSSEPRILRKGKISLDEVKGAVT